MTCWGCRRRVVATERAIMPRVAPTYATKTPATTCNTTPSAHHPSLLIIRHPSRVMKNDHKKKKKRVMNKISSLCTCSSLL